jgi:hypothetical protein
MPQEVFMVDEIVEKCNDPSFLNTSWAFGPPVQEPVPPAYYSQ